MCTAGAILENKELILFKNLDLKKRVRIFVPKILKGKYKYIGCKRQGRPGIWAGINNQGLGLVATSALTNKKYQTQEKTINKIFYEKTISNCKNTKEAFKLLKNFYQKEIFSPDIVLIADFKKALIFEFSPENLKIKEIKFGFILRTNHFCLLTGAISKNKCPNTYLRYKQAKKILDHNKSFESIKNLCKNHSNGPSINSICCHGKKEKNKTVASVIMKASKDLKNISCYYVINNYPCRAEYKIIKLK